MKHFILISLGVLFFSSSFSSEKLVKGKCYRWNVSSLEKHKTVGTGQIAKVESHVSSITFNKRKIPTVGALYFNANNNKYDEKVYLIPIQSIKNIKEVKCPSLKKNKIDDLVEQVNSELTAVSFRIGDDFLETCPAEFKRIQSRHEGHGLSSVKYIKCRSSKKGFFETILATNKGTKYITSLELHLQKPTDCKLLGKELEKKVNPGIIKEHNFKRRLADDTSILISCPWGFNLNRHPADHFYLRVYSGLENTNPGFHSANQALDALILQKTVTTLNGTTLKTTDDLISYMKDIYQELEKLGRIDRASELTKKLYFNHKERFLDKNFLNKVIRENRRQ